jgi:hypothetical protein
MSDYESGYEGDAGGFVSDSGFDSATGTRTPLKPQSASSSLAATAAVAAAKLAQQKTPSINGSIIQLPTSPTPRSSQAAAAMLEMPLSKAEKIRLDIETLKRETCDSFRLNVDDSIDVESVLDAALSTAERDRLLKTAAPTSGNSETVTSTTTTSATSQQQPLLIRKYVARHYELSIELAKAIEEGNEPVLEGEEEITRRIKALVPNYNPPLKVLPTTATDATDQAASISSIAAELHAIRILSEAHYLLSTHAEATRRREHEELITVLKRPLQKRGMTIQELRQCGLTSANLRAAGYTLLELLESHCISIQELKAEKFTTSDLRLAGCTANELKNVYTASECKGGGYTFDELINAQFPLSELRIAGVHGKDLIGRFTDDQLLTAGYRRSMSDLWSNF